MAVAVDEDPVPPEVLVFTAVLLAAVVGKSVGIALSAFRWHPRFNR